MAALEEAPRMDILAQAKFRWLTNEEIYCLLMNPEMFGLFVVTHIPQKPESGEVFLFDKSQTKRFRKDGYNWKKKKDGKQVREDHVKLKIKRKEVLNCTYAHSLDSQVCLLWYLNTVFFFLSFFFVKIKFKFKKKLKKIKHAR